MPNTDSDLLQHALIGLDHRKEEITQAVADIRSRLHGSAPKQAARPTAKHHGMSAAAKKRMSLMMKRRWAKAKKAGRKGLG